jgi:Fe-S cluster assembly ATP-binding protein
MIEIKNLHVNAGETEILHGIDLKVNSGETHAIMGPNGSGKSTLGLVIAGHEDYEVTEGDILFDGESILEMESDERACKGIFLAFQQPVEIPGVGNTHFLRSAVNAIRKYRGQDEWDALDFMDQIKDKLELLELKQDLLKRQLNVGFSGGEKKRNEILQMLVLDPKLAVLDETDSGLDIDALQIVAKGVNAHRGPDHAEIVITHYQRLLNYIIPDFVHVLYNGRIIKSGGKELALELEQKGYGWLTGNGNGIK